MAQSRMVAKNTFGEGLIMDFAPDNTLANVLSNALNATLLTYNGNEMSLLNDMGNGRVETAFLPEGYMPMGACEFGGIIYVVSYNPQSNLCQIGSFPSPERNITKEDKSSVGDLNSPALTTDYFQEIKNGQLTGKLNSLVSKVIIREDSLNPGDKYIIQSNRASYTQDDLDSISDLANDDIAKRVKFSIVSIEDSGKITKLETINHKVIAAGLEKSYNILNSNSISPSMGTDIDAYRQNLKLNYNVFSSKIPGKLAILAELEVIDTFSCGHLVLTKTLKIKGSTQEYTTYDVYIDYRWESEDPTINPKYVTLTKFEWESTLGESNSYAKFYDASGSEITLLMDYSRSKGEFSTSGYISNDRLIHIELPLLISDDTSYFYHTINSKGKLDFTNYTYKRSYYEDHERLMRFRVTNEEHKTEDIIITLGKEVGEVEINNGLGLSNTVYLCSITVPSRFNDYVFRLPFKLRYAITPAMDFGLLDHLTVENEIDFSLIGTKLVQPTGLKYFASQDVLTLNIDSEIYEEENHKVTNMVLEFYDVNGFAGSYFFEDRESYSGNTVVNIPFNSLYLRKYKYGGDEFNPWYHNILDPLDAALNNGNPQMGMNADTGDCGIIYSNMLYGVKLLYVYSSLDPITLDVQKDGADIIEKGFWLYTNGQFNDFYYSVDNFSSIKFEMPLMYSYKLKDNTSKYGIKLTEETESTLQTLLNAENAHLDLLNTMRLPLITTANYKGDIDLELNIGIALGSIFALMENQTMAPPTVNLRLLSPYDAAKSFAVIEENESNEAESDEILEKSIGEFTDYGTTQFTAPNQAVTFNSMYEAKAKLNLNLLDVLFKIIPTLYKKSIIKTTILTPILYKKEAESQYNYEDIGGLYLFNKSLCYTGSDDAASDLALANSDDCWYETSINPDSYATYDSLLHEYDKGTIHTNLVDGHESLLKYYGSLGNRQPFTLFTILRPLPTADSQVGYSVYFTHNVEGPGNVCTKESSNKGYKYDYSWTGSLKFSIIHKLKNNGSSEYSPNYKDRSYIPAFITERIANGGYDAAISSSGGAYSQDAIKYTAHTGYNLKNFFYPKYVQTMKELVTVNPDLTTCESGTFEYLEESCKNLELISVLGATINVDSNFKNAAKELLVIHGIKFTRYIQNLLNLMDPEQKLLKPYDNNVSAIFNTTLLGDGLEVAVTYINYRMPHEHELVDDFLNTESSGLIRYSNGYYDLGTSNYVNTWSSLLHRVNIDIEESAFYMLCKPANSNLLLLLKITTSTHKTNSLGHITIGGWSGSRSNTRTGYMNSAPPLFYNTNMTVDDFTWDPSNKKHHFYFNNEGALTIVDSTYSYQLDDDYGKGGDHLIVRSYYIGPSFNSTIS